MATSFFLQNSSNGNKRGEREEDQRSKITEEQEARLETGKQRGRRSGKSKAPRRPPQRGLGVAQLERLRLQERWKKMTEFDQLQAQNLHCQFQYQMPFSFMDQQPDSIRVPFSRFSSVNYGYGSFGDGQSSSQQAFVFHSYKQGNGGFLAGAGGGSGVRGVFSNQLQVDRYRIAAQDAWFQSGNTTETTKELSSIQKIHCLSEQREICSKKKRISGKNLGFAGGREKYKELLPVAGPDFLGLNPGGNKIIDGDSRNIGVKGSLRSDYSDLNVEEEVDVVAVHGKRNSAGSSSLAEYEFFPRKGIRSSSNKESSSLAEASASSSVLSEASLTNTSNFIDLSLKLSC